MEHQITPLRPQVQAILVVAPLVLQAALRLQDQQVPQDQLQVLQEVLEVPEVLGVLEALEVLELQQGGNNISWTS